MTKKQFNQLDNSEDSFRILKKATEKDWEKVKYDECWGWQIQEGTKWRKGLTELELLDFQEQVGFNFPDSLKNYFRVMNGLDKLEVNFGGDLKDEPDFGRTWRTYPESIEYIKSTTKWILEGNSVPEDMYDLPKFPKIFPYHIHRCLVLDTYELALSMWGNDIIYWSSSLIKGIAKDCLGFYAPYGNQLPQGFWYDRVDLNPPPKPNFDIFLTS